MIVTAPDGVYYDPYDVEINADPYRAFRTIREEAPLYYNEQHDFYALSRFPDVDRALVDHETFSSARGAIIELIKANIDIPPGVIIFEDPPIHDVHRKLLARMFTPRKISDEDVERALVHKTVERVGRKGKYFWLSPDDAGDGRI